MPSIPPAARAAALALSCALASPALSAPLSADGQALLTTALEDARAASGTAGVSATITEDGRTVWQSAAGLSDVAAGKPFTLDTLSSVASVTKPVTASIVLKLVEQGRLSLDSPIAPYVPSYIPGASQVTIRDLLSMRSGYADIENAPAYIDAAADPNHVWSRQELFRPIAAPHFAPGSREEYSNVNYLLLGQVIDSVYPGGVAAAFDRFVAGPAKLGGDVVFKRDPKAAGRFAHGYLTQNGQTVDTSAGARNLGISTGVWGTLFTDGGIGATSGGLAKFGDALFSGRIVSLNTLAQMEAPLQDSDYGLGLESADLGDGHAYVGHIGVFDGYTAALLHDSARDVTIAVVADSLDADTGSQLGLLLSLVDAFDAADAAGAIPEPAGFAVLGFGFAVLAVRRRG